MNPLPLSLLARLSSYRRRRTPADALRAACTPVAARHLRSAAALVEALEQRRLLSTTYSSGVLSVIGSSSADTITVSVSAGSVVVTENGTPTNTGAAPSAVTNIIVAGNDGDDSIDLSAVTAANGFTNASLPGNITLSGNLGNDTLKGSALADSISGGDGADQLFGNAGNDSLKGDAGDSDFLEGGAGNDALDGGTGANDSVGYGDDPAGITATFNATATDGYGGADTLANFEILYGSGYADTLYGAPGITDVIIAGSGNDTITGTTGNDIIFPEGGDDVVDGGTGYNSVSYLYSPAGLSGTLNGSLSDGYGGTDSLSNIQALYGSNYADSITGSSGDDQIHGNAGNDTIAGAGGNDLLYGEDGGDVLYGDAGDDSVYGGNDDDAIYGGAGDDTLDGGAGGNNTVLYADPAGISGTMNGTVTDGYGDTDALANFTQLYGTNYADHIYGTASGFDVLYGGLGNDTITGQGANDIIFGDAGDDTLDGGAGYNTVNYRYDGAGVTVVMNATATDGSGGHDTLSNFQAVHGSEYADSITGSSANDELHGRGGNDTLVATGGSDYLDPGTGTNTVVVNSGSATLATAGTTDTLTVNGGSLDVQTHATFSSVSVANGATLAFSDDTEASVVGSLSLAPTATLDLGDTSLVVDYTGTSPISDIRTALASGYNAGGWDGTGISTSAFASSSQPLGYAEASDVLGLSGASVATWQGATVDATSILIRPTWYGDTDLDGAVSADDYARANDAVHAAALNDPASRPAYATWANGDFNYDTAIDADDYALLYANTPGHGTGLYDVADYGAALDGSTDDTAAIQDAIDDAPDGSIILIGGNAAVAGQLVISARSNLVILGTSPSSGIIYTADGQPAGRLFEAHFIITDDASDNPSSRITVAGLHFDGNSYGGTLLGIQDSDHVTVRDNSFSDQDTTGYNANYSAVFAIGNTDDTYSHNTLTYVAHGLYIGSSHVIPDNAEHNSVITDNHIEHTVGSPIGLLAIGADVERNYVNDVTGGSGMTVAGKGTTVCQNANIRNNEFHDIDWTGVQSDSWELEGAAGDNTPPDPLLNVLIEDNIIDGCGVNGVWTRWAENWSILNNTITNCQNGVSVDSSAGVTVSGNTITVSSTASLGDYPVGVRVLIAPIFGPNGHWFYDVAATDTTISDNIISIQRTTGIGIHVWSQGTGSTISGLDISDNTISNCGNTGIILKVDGGGTLDASLDGNTVTNSTYNGIYIEPDYGSLSASLTNNTSLANGQYGVYVNTLGASATLSLNGGDDSTAKNDVITNNVLSGGSDPNNTLGDIYWVV